MRSSHHRRSDSGRCAAARTEAGGNERVLWANHGRILRLARQSTSDGAWKAKLREILAEFDDDPRHLSVSEDRLLREELASQIEQEALQFSDPTKSAVLI